MFRASKYRNVLGSNLPREEWYEELYLDDGRLDLYPIAANLTQIAFVSQLNSGSCIEIKELKDTGKANGLPKKPRIVRGHTQRVNTLEYNPFHATSKSILASGADDNMLKLWNLEINEEDDPCIWTYEAETSTKILNVAFHPSALNILSVSTPTSISLVDLERQQTASSSMTHPELITGCAWSYDGSSLVSVCQDNKMRLWDPRQSDESLTKIIPGHQGRKPASIVWCKDEYFLTCGFNSMQEREVMLWDLKNIEKPLARERIDSGTGLLQPIFDEDSSLLFLTGRGDKIVRTWEVNTRRPFFTPLQQTNLFRPLWGATKLPKMACDLEKCEVVRLLSIGQNAIEPLSYTVPRREAANQFQADLYPDSRSNTAAMTSAEYFEGGNSTPVLKKVELRSTSSSQPSISQFSSGTEQKSGWNSTSGWGSSASTASQNPQQPQAVSTGNSSTWNSSAGWGESPQAPPPAAMSKEEKNESAMLEISEKAKKLGAIQGHKFKYITGRALPRSETYQNIVSSDGSVLVASKSYWATTLSGTGGPVLVHPLTQVGKVENPRVLNGHKLSVTDIDFNPFYDNVLATASDDSTIQVWSLENVEENNTPVATLEGHGRGVRCLSYHPTSDNVLASGSMDNTIRLWDIQTTQTKQEFNKFEEAPYNISFNYDGSQFATISRDRVLRVIDPRLNKTVAMSCAHEGSNTQKVLWCTKNDSPTLFTVGFNGRSERQLAVWDARNLLDPVTMINIDTSGSVLMPFYDESSHVVYLVSRGDRSILSYEIDSDKLLPCSPFSFPGAPIAAATMLPKQLCNIRDVEVSRFLVLTKTSVEPVVFSLPRAEKLKQFFQDDIYGPIRAYDTPLSSSEWFDGTNKQPASVSLQPADMLSVSERPSETPNAPKVIDFKAKKIKEEEEKRQRDEQFQRLQQLAYQPSLHAQRKHTNDEDEDDGWDD